MQQQQSGRPDMFACFPAPPGTMATWGGKTHPVIAFHIVVHSDDTAPPPTPITAVGSPDEQWEITYEKRNA